MKNSKTIGIVILLLVIVFMTACTQSIGEIQTTDNVDEKVSIKGTVEGSIKLGDLSGFTISDETGQIFVSSTEEFPQEGETVLVSGTLKKNILGYYIQE